MKRSWMKLLILAGVLPATMMGAGQAQAAGMASLEGSASAMGVGNAFTATADDPTAMIFNPAGLAWQPGLNIAFSAATRFRNQSVKQTTALGTPYNHQKPSAVGGFYETWMPEGSDFGLGIAIDQPYSLRNAWNSAFGGAAKSTSVDVTHEALDVVYALNSNLAVALGGDLYVAKGSVNSATTNFTGKDKFSAGGHVSAMWHPLPAWSVGGMLKSGSTIKLSGTAAGAVNGSASVKVKLPDVARLGVMHVFNDRWRVEADASWTRWSTMKNLDVVGTTSERNPLSMRDSLGLMTGLTWFWRENTVLRFGYAFDQSAVKDGGLTARIVDNNQQRFSIGAGGDLFDMHLDLAYVYAYSPNRTINNGSVYDGTWRTREQSLALSVSKRF